MTRREDRGGVYGGMETQEAEEEMEEKEGQNRKKTKRTV